MITHGEKVTRTIYTYEFLICKDSIYFFVNSFGISIVCKDSQSTSLESPLGFPFLNLQGSLLLCILSI